MRFTPDIPWPAATGMSHSSTTASSTCFPLGFRSPTARRRVGRSAEEASEQAAFPADSGAFLVGVLSVAPLVCGNCRLHLVDMLTASFPRGLSTHLADSWSTHCFLLMMLRLGSAVDSLRVVGRICFRSGFVLASGQAEEQLLEFFDRYLVRFHNRLRLRSRAGAFVF